MGLEKYKLAADPVCRKEAVLQGDKYRISILTTGLIRFEYSEDGEFEDRATQMVCRNFPVPNFVWGRAVRSLLFIRRIWKSIMTNRHLPPED